MGPTLFYGGPKSPPPKKKADFAMKQTNICRLSGDINYLALKKSCAISGAVKSVSSQCAMLVVSSCNIT